MLHGEVRNLNCHNEGMSNCDAQEHRYRGQKTTVIQGHSAKPTYVARKRCSAREDAECGDGGDDRVLCAHVVGDVSVFCVLLWHGLGILQP